MDFKLNNTYIIFSRIFQALKVKCMLKCLQYHFWKLEHEVSLKIYKYINISITENLATIHITRIIEFQESILYISILSV